MKDWLRRLRGALGMGLTWGVAGALLGMVMEVLDSQGQIADIWPAVLAVPAFFGGVLFSAVLAVAGRRRRFDELSIPRFAAWGAVGGALLSLVPVGMAAVGLVTLDVPAWRLTAALIGPLTLGSASAAAGSLALARTAEDRDLLEAGERVAEVGLTEAEAQELWGGDS